MCSISTATALAAVAFLSAAAPAHAYVDLAPTLATVVNSSQAIAVAEVDRFSLEKGVVVLKKVRDLKGEVGTDPIRQRVIGLQESSVDRIVLDWAEPGARCVLFASGKTTLVCVGRGWYQVHAAGDDWQQLGAPRPDLPLAYYGSVSRLSDALARMLAGKTAVITTLQHGAADREAASFDLALNRAAVPSLVKVERIRASLHMPGVVMAVSANPAYKVGLGQAGEEEIPDLKKKLRDADATVRAESAADLGSLGPRAADAADDLAKLLDDGAPAVRTAAAAALLRINPRAARAADVLARGLASEDSAVRRQAARAVGQVGAAAAPLADKLGALLTGADAPTRRAALGAVAALGPAAAGTIDSIVPLLDRPETAIDAADALGRIGPAARPALKHLARMLESDSAAERWAAVRAMAQIGGAGAAPAVQFMIPRLAAAPEVDAYHMLIYLALLGPVAKDALPVVERTRFRMNGAVQQATLWAIEPDKRFPWLGGGPFGMPMGDADFTQWVYESYVQELGDRLKPAAAALAKKIMDGSAGNVPSWGYKILARFPEESLAVLTPGLASDQAALRERAAVALGYMGPAAAPASAKVAEAVEKAPGEKEKLLLKWCLREIE